MNNSQTQMNPKDFETLNKNLTSAVWQFFWQSSSRYDDEVLDLVIDDIENNRIDFDNYIFDNIDELAFKLMRKQMIKLGHL